MIFYIPNVYINYQGIRIETIDTLDTDLLHKDCTVTIYKGLVILNCFTEVGAYSNTLKGFGKYILNINIFTNKTAALWYLRKYHEGKFSLLEYNRSQGNYKFHKELNKAKRLI